MSIMLEVSCSFDTKQYVSIITGRFIVGLYYNISIGALQLSKKNKNQKSLNAKKYGKTLHSQLFTNSAFQVKGVEILETVFSSNCLARAVLVELLRQSTYSGDSIV